MLSSAQGQPSATSARRFRGAKTAFSRRVFIGGRVRDGRSRSIWVVPGAMLAAGPDVLHSGMTCMVAVMDPSSLRGWIRWCPNDETFHPALCDKVKENLHSKDWRYATKPPTSNTVCPHCAALLHASPDTLDGDPVVDFVRRTGWARDYFTAPIPSQVLGSYPPRLPPELLVDVTDNTVSGFRKMADCFIPLLEPGNPQPGYFIRSGSGWGKTFNLQEVLTWVIVASVEFEQDCVTATGERAKLQRRVQHNVISKLQQSDALGLARAVTAFCVNFNGSTPYSAAEAPFAKTVGAEVCFHLRLCYTELADPKKVKWRKFLEGVGSAIHKKELVIDDMVRAGDSILSFCRGSPGGVPLLVVDEVAKVIGPYSVPLKLDWCEAICSAACQTLQVLNGMVMFSTLQYDIMKRECSRSGRRMHPAIELSSLEPAAFANAVVAELAPLFSDSVVRLAGIGLVVTGDTPSPALSFVLLICGLLGGHPRYVARFLEELKKQVAHLVGAQSSFSQRTIFSDVVQHVCWVSLDDALSTYSVAAIRGSDGSEKFMNNIVAAALLCRPVRLDDIVIECKSGTTVEAVTWDILGSESVVLLEKQGQTMSGTEKQGQMKSGTETRGQTKSGKVLDLDYATPRLHSLTALKLACLARSGRCDIAFKDLLLCPGERLTGERLELVIANWCVVSSYCRAEYPTDYAHMTLEKVWDARPHPHRSFGNNFLRHVQVDATATRKSGVRRETMDDVVKFVAKHPERATDAVFRLNTGAARRPQFVIDLVEFFRVSQAFGRYKVGDLIMAVYQSKDCGLDASGSPSLSHVNKGWELLETSVLAAGGMWDQWKDNIVFVYANRYTKNFGTRESKSRAKFESGRACSQTVLLSGSDLSGWLPDPIPAFLSAAERLDQADAEETLSRFWH